MERKPVLRSEKGFTLIEIISVLVLIGILAAVAVPKFINLQEDARDKAAEAAVAEGIAQLNLLSARHILITSTVPPDLAALESEVIMGTDKALENPYNAGDFDITFSGAGNVITVQADGVAGNVVGADASAIITLPVAE